jgi:ferrous iron transport protein A
MKEMYLTQLKEKQTAVVKEIVGGHGVAHRLEALGIRPGKKITKISSHFWRGPVTVMVDKAKVAIGHGMAQKIMVEV